MRGAHGRGPSRTSQARRRSLVEELANADLEAISRADVPIEQEYLDLEYDD